MSTIQAGIAAHVPAHGRYLSLSLRPGAEGALRSTLQALAREADGLHTVVGLGATLVSRLDAAIPGLRSFSAPPTSRVDLPATPVELWLWLRSEGEDPGALLHRGRALARLLAPAFDITHELAAFRHQSGRDLTGYEDGTENPTGRDLIDTIGVQGQGPGLDGGSFVAVQQWEHALDRFDRFDRTTQDRLIGRRRQDNVELEDAPASAHVKRTAQESFSPEAFVLRRSMPWIEGTRCGLLFTAFATGFDAFEAQLARMAGVEDGVVDDLFRFSQPVSGAYFWCPPVGPTGLDLSRFGA